MSRLITAKVIQVIEVVHSVGSGIETDPHRWVYSYLTSEGKLLAERDTWKDEKDAAASIQS